MDDPRTRLGIEGAMPPRVLFSDSQPSNGAANVEERYRTLAEASGQIIWNTTAEGLAQDEPSWCAFTGQHLDEAREWGWLEAIHPDDRQPTRRTWLEAVAAQRLYETEYRIRRFDGVYRDFLVRGVPILDERGAIREWAGLCTDITDRKQIEQERDRLLSEAQAAHADAESAVRQLRAVLDVLPIGVFIADAQGRLLHRNAAATLAIGTEAREVHTPEEDVLSSGHWTATDRLLMGDEQTLARALQAGEPITGDEITIETFEGQHRVVEHSAVPIRDESGAITGAVVAVRDVTEQRQLEEALEQTAREAAARASQFEAIFESITDGVIVCDLNGRMLHLNAAYRRLLALDRVSDDAVRTPEGRGKVFSPRDHRGRLLPPEQRPMARILRGEVLTSATAQDLMVRTADGRELLINASGAPVRDSAGQVIGGVAIFRDVTERRHLEREVVARASQLEAILEAMADGVFVFDHEGGVLETNSAGRELFQQRRLGIQWKAPLQERGYRSLVQDTGERVLAPPEWPLFRVLRGEILKGPTAVDIHVRTPAGQDLDLQVSGAPLRVGSAEPSGAVCVVRDVTDRRRMERHTREALSALLAMAESLVLEPIGGGGMPEERATQDIDMVARRLVELTRNVLGCRRATLTAFDPKRGAVPVAAAGMSEDDERRWLASEEGYRLGDRPQSGELLARLQAGETVVLDMSEPPWNEQANPLGIRRVLLVPMRTDRGVLGVLSLDYESEVHIFTDDERLLAAAAAQLAGLVVERARLRRERARAQARELALAETNRRMNDFLGIAGHELRTPLTTINASAQLAERRLRRTAAAPSASPDEMVAQITATAEMMRRIHQQVGRLDRLVSDLLDVSRIQADKLDLRPSWCDLATVVRDAVQDHAQLDPARTITLDLLAEGPVMIYVDCDRISQVVTNYLTNALKYSRAELPVHAGLEVISSPAGRQARVYIRDYGPGLSQADQEHIWERFFRAEGIEPQSGSGVGLGLGLHISKTIIDRHQGQMGVESKPGKGSTFWFTLPLDNQTL